MANGLLNGNLLNSQSRNVAAAAAVLAVSSVASRLLGVARDWLISEKFGAGADTDIYFAAFRIPDFIYNILIFGGIAVAFLPLFSEYYAKNKEDAWKFAANTLNAFLVFLAALAAILFLFAPQLSAWIAPGFGAQQMEKLVAVTRLMLLSPILFGVAAIFSGVLQYFHRFVAFSLAPSLYNLGIIIGILFLAPSMGITGVALGVILGAALYLAIQIPPAVKCGFKLSFKIDFSAPSLRRVFAQIAPRTFGIASNQINQAVTTAVASSLAAGSISVFNLSNNLYGIPVGIIGISYATAAFPALSKSFAAADISGVARKFASAFRQIAYIALPASFFMFAVRGPIVDLLYFHGKFSAQAALLASASLGVFCAGIIFAALMPLVFRLFFSFQDALSPSVSTVISVAANIFLNFYFIRLLQSGGGFEQAVRNIFGIPAGDISVLALAVAFTVANAIQFAVLVLLLKLKNPLLVLWWEISRSFAKALVAALIMFFAVFLFSARISTATAAAELIGLAVAAAIACVVYFASTSLLKSAEPKEIIAAVFAKKDGTSQPN